MSKAPHDNKLPQNLPTAWQNALSERIDECLRYKSSPGRAALLKYLKGSQIGRREAMLAKCAECCYGYADRKMDCENYLCPLYPWMPYKGKG